MKGSAIVFVLFLCLFSVSCSSTPPAEDPPEDAATQEISSELATTQSSDAAGDSTTVPLAVSPDGAADPSVPSDAFPVEEFLPPVAEVPGTDSIAAETGAAAGPDSPSSEYIEEIEIVDLVESTETNLTATGGSLDSPDVALVVETLPEEGGEEPVAPEVQEIAPETVPALVVETVVDSVVPEPVPAEIDQDAAPAEEPVQMAPPAEETFSLEATSEELPAVLEPSPAELDQTTEPVPAVESVPVVTEESATAQLSDEEMPPVALEPVAVNTTQGVVDTPVEPSRSITMDKGQFLDIRYPGSGWVYLGEVTAEGVSIGTPSLTYFGRRRTSEDTSFTLKSTKSGTTILHFYKQDVLTATFIDDFLEVGVSETDGTEGSRILAPDYESLVPDYQERVPNPVDFVRQDVTPTEPILEQTSAAASAQSAATSTSTQVATTTQPTTSSAGGGQTSTSVPAASVAPATDQRTAVTQVIPTRPDTVDQNETGAAQPTTTRQPANATTDNTGAGQSATTATGATVVVPPRSETGGTQSYQNLPTTTTVAGSGSQVDRGQELYLPETSVVTTESAQNGYNPETGLPMENMDLPWVTQELERQRTADIQASQNQPNQETGASPDKTLEQDALLAQAQEYFYAEDFPASLETLNQFFAIAVSDFDAAYYLKGQVLESKSSIGNIKEARNAYKHVIDSYPQSPFWQRAKNRYTYLGRFYFDIR